MKTFGEINVGDVMYSLNYREWGILTEHIVTDVKRNDFWSAITIKGYLKYQIIGDPDSPKADYTIVKSNKLTVGEVAPSVEGVKEFWLRETQDRINEIEKKIEEENKRLEIEYSDLQKIKNIHEKYKSIER